MLWHRPVYRINAVDERVRRGWCIETPANTAVEGVVKEIKVQTRTLKVIGEVSRFYQIQLMVDSKANWYGNVAASRVAEDDLRLTIGERVSFSCFRDHTYRALSPAGWPE